MANNNRQCGNYSVNSSQNVPMHISNEESKAELHERKKKTNQDIMSMLKVGKSNLSKY